MLDLKQAIANLITALTEESPRKVKDANGNSKQLGIVNVSSSTLNMWHLNPLTAGAAYSGFLFLLAH